MCGIAGVLSLTGSATVDEHLLRRQTAVLSHRGPDESGIYVDGVVGLASARLSIIGIAGGTQPICNEDRSLWIVFNGEIFNYVELKEDLLRKGHRFATSTDTEVILHLFEDLGPKALARLNGQFAIAIWNRRTRELFLARDRVGIRPLFFTQAAGKLLFGSEIKALFLDPDVRRELDPVSLFQIFTFWTTIGGRTAFAEVREVSPGHYLLIRDGRILEKCFWEIPVRGGSDLWSGSLDEAVDALEELFVDAVRLRLRADVPVGAYLSGGLDSSLTTAVIARHFDNHLRTFSMTFEEERFDESRHQQELVRHLGTEHSSVQIRNDDVAESLSDVIWHCETPLLRTGPVPLFRLSRLVRRSGFKVVVAGEGADEVFGGYNIFKEAKVRQFWAKQPDSKWRPLLLERLYPYVFTDPARTRHFLRRFYDVRPGDAEDPLFSHRVRWRNTGSTTAFLSDARRAAVAGYEPMEDVTRWLPEEFERWDWLARAQMLEMKVFLSNYLLSSQGDRVAMAHSVEGRVPFLDHRIIDFAFGLPAHWKIRGLDEKHILKRLGTRYLPASITDRPKQPYRAPIQEAFSNLSRSPYLSDLLSQNSLRNSGHFDARRVDLLLKRTREGRTVNEVQNMALVGIATTEVLQRQFIDDFPHAATPRVPDRAVREVF